MTPRGLTLLGLVALVAIGMALWLAQDRSAQRQAVSGELYPDLTQRLESLEQVQIDGSGAGVDVTLQRAEQGWQVVERSGYQVDMARLRTLLRNLAEAELVEEKSAQAGNYAALGVADPDEADSDEADSDEADSDEAEANGADSSEGGAGGVRVVLAGMDPPVDLIVGNQATGRSGSYVRRSGEAQSWLVNRTFDVPREPGQWIDRDVLDIGADRIQSATVEVAEQRYEAAKSSRADTDFAVTGVLEGRELTSPGAANGLATALVRLQADDVRRFRPSEEPEPTAAATFRTFDGLVLELQGYTIDDEQYLVANARADAELAARFAAPAAAAEASESAKGGEGEADRAADDTGSGPEDASTDASETSADTGVASEVERINDRVAGWAYAIPDYKYDAVFRPLEELLAPRDE